MIWPFVHRARLEAFEREAQAARDAERELRVQLVEMTKLVAEMKRVGFERAHPVELEPVEREESPAVDTRRTSLPGEVLVAISERAVEHTPLWRQLVRQAEVRVAGGADGSDVASWILRGSDTDEILYGLSEG